MEDWPSARVSQGGIFAPRANKYSTETHNFLKVLMEEQKLSMLQRKQVNRCLREGTSLPQRFAKEQQPQEERISMDPCPLMSQVLRSPRLRTQSVIRNSGAYDVPKMPFRPLVDREKAKEHLQNIMVGYDQGSYANYLRGNKGTRKNIQKAPKQETPDRVDELMEEIQERITWLKDMTELGKGKQHTEVIRQQVAEKMRQIKALKEIPADTTKNKDDCTNAE
ncbi:UPF0193 protein EVG1 homolog [Ctenocephalides felis]|uniref:UPF0193 protein EVG1 homolog n=1 Tax=Ctenocephalides felis TaxID=7515 RepID=UPI000E6E2A61|nr:UPF0193 protein EVG1 homolog [Ctenocephalides felis]